MSAALPTLNQELNVLGATVREREDTQEFTDTVIL